jgi:ketosteroid isomerase-like protein
VFSWFVGTSSYVAQNSVSVLADSISAGGKEKGEEEAGSSASGDNYDARSEVKEVEDEEGHTRVTLPSPPKQRPPHERTASTSSSLGGLSRPGSGKSDATGRNGKSGSNEAMKVLRGYYDAFNKHDIAGAVGYLAEDVKVRFPDETKNWATAEAANDRYATMFRKSPNLKGKFSLLDIVHEGAKTTITVYCHFTCSISGVDTVREMVYVIQGQKICIIDNKY